MVAIVRLADQLDRLLVSDPPTDKKAVRALARGPDRAQVELSERYLRSSWSELFLARAEAVSLFT